MGASCSPCPVHDARHPGELGVLPRGPDAGRRVGVVGHRRLLVEQGGQPGTAALGTGEGAHRVDERREGVAHGDGDDDEQRRHGGSRRRGVGEGRRGQGRRGGGDEEGCGHERAPPALPAHRAAQRLVRLGRASAPPSPPHRWPAARRPGGRRGRSPAGPPPATAAARRATATPAATPPRTWRRWRRAAPAGRAPRRAANHAASPAATSPANALDSTGTVTRTCASTTSVRSSTTPVSTLARDRRPSRAGVSGTRAAYTAVRRRARSSRAASCETSRSR